MSQERRAQLKKKDKKSKMSFEDMVVDAIVSLAERGGSSLTSIRRYVLDAHPETQAKQAASYNSLSLKALTSAVAKGKLERDKHTYKLSSNYVRQLNKKAQSVSSDMQPRRSESSAADEFQVLLTPFRRLE